MAYYMAQMEVAFEKQGEYPLFIIDDVDSELDTMRIHQLLRFSNQNPRYS